MAKRAAANKQEEPESFEAALKELEDLTATMEGDDVALDRSLELYERGIFLRDFCQARLDAAEKQIERLTRSADGRLGTAAMSGGDDGESAA